MTKPLGRSDDMMIIRGVNVFPSQIEAVLLKEGYSPNYQIVVDRENNTDTFDIYVEFSPEQFSDKIADVQAREKALISANFTDNSILTKEEKPWRSHSCPHFLKTDPEPFTMP